jgi:hypothetical protein
MSLTRVRQRLVSALLWCVLTALGGAVLLVVGIGLMAGIGSACLAAGVLCLLASSVILRGLGRV